MVDMESCDACGELKPYAGGEHFTDYTGWPDEQPVESWICADCVQVREEQEIWREEDRIEQYYDLK